MSERASAGAPTGAGFVYALARRVVAVEPAEAPALA